MAERTAGIERGRDAVRRESWAEAYEQLTAADRSDLTAVDLEALADAAWWMSKTDEAIAARRQAYAAFSAAGEELKAASNAREIILAVGEGELSVSDVALAATEEPAKA